MTGENHENRISLRTSEKHSQIIMVMNLFDEEWTPNCACSNCFITVLQLHNGRRNQMPYSKPMMWEKDPNEHAASTCYGCIHHVPGINKKRVDLYCIIVLPTLHFPKKIRLKVQ